MVGGNSDRLMSDINVTPFVDVMLVLLIIFMVTAPMMMQGVDVSLRRRHPGRCPPKRTSWSLPSMISTRFLSVIIRFPSSIFAKN